MQRINFLVVLLISLTIANAFAGVKDTSLVQKHVQGDMQKYIVDYSVRDKEAGETISAKFEWTWRTASVDAEGNAKIKCSYTAIRGSAAHGETKTTYRGGKWTKRHHAKFLPFVALKGKHFKFTLSPLGRVTSIEGLKNIRSSIRKKLGDDSSAIANRVSRELSDAWIGRIIELITTPRDSKPFPMVTPKAPPKNPGPLRAPREIPRIRGYDGEATWKISSRHTDTNASGDVNTIYRVPNTLYEKLKSGARALKVEYEGKNRLPLFGASGSGGSSDGTSKSSSTRANFKVKGSSYLLHPEHRPIRGEARIEWSSTTVTKKRKDNRVISKETSKEQRIHVIKFHAK